MWNEGLSRGLCNGLCEIELIEKIKRTKLNEGCFCTTIIQNYVVNKTNVVLLFRCVVTYSNANYQTQKAVVPSTKERFVRTITIYINRITMKIKCYLIKKT